MSRTELGKTDEERSRAAYEVWRSSYPNASPELEGLWWRMREAMVAFFKAAKANPDYGELKHAADKAEDAYYAAVYGKYWRQQFRHMREGGESDGSVNSKTDSHEGRSERSGG